MPPFYRFRPGDDEQQGSQHDDEDDRVAGGEVEAVGEQQGGTDRQNAEDPGEEQRREALLHRGGVGGGDEQREDHQHPRLLHRRSDRHRQRAEEEELSRQPREPGIDEKHHRRDRPVEHRRLHERFGHREEDVGGGEAGEELHPFTALREYQHDRRDAQGVEQPDEGFDVAHPPGREGDEHRRRQGEEKRQRGTMLPVEKCGAHRDPHRRHLADRQVGEDHPTAEDLQPEKGVNEDQQQRQNEGGPEDFDQGHRRFAIVS